MHTNSIQLHRATAADLKELQALCRQTFFETFASDNTTENMQYYLETSFSENNLWEELNNPDSAFYLSKAGSKVIGYLKINSGEAQTEFKDNKGIEIERIYVLKEFHGKQVGQLLFDKAVQLAKENHADYIWLGVWEKNPRAIKFYVKNGFVPFGTHLFKLGNDEQTDIMMKLQL